MNDIQLVNDVLDVVQSHATVAERAQKIRDLVRSEQNEEEEER